MTTKTFDRLRTQEDVRTLYIHQLAADAIKSMFGQCQKIKVAFGVGEEYGKAVLSLHHCLAALLGRGFSTEAYVTKENEFNGAGLSLFVQEGDAFVFGIVWFRDRSYDDTPKAGIAGEWSTHS